MGEVQVSHLHKSYDGANAVDDVSFSVESGQFVTLLGPSGCGKTTTLRCLAGLEKPEQGVITIGSNTNRVFDAERSVFVPPERRGLGMVFQSYAIWPHMTVFQNVAYGLRAARITGDSLRQRVQNALEMMGLEQYAERSATKLSGGQQQRVALARSLVTEPKVLLLDEPLSNLDAKLRDKMRFELKELQRRLGITTIYVTHDQAEALVLSDRIIVMEDGKVVQDGSPEEIYRQPLTRFVTDFIGQSNLLEGSISRLLPAEGSAALAEVQVGRSQIVGAIDPTQKDSLSEGANVTISIRPETLSLSREAEQTQDNGWPVLVKERVFMGNFCELHLTLAESIELRMQASYDSPFQPGESVFLRVEPHNVRLFASPTKENGGRYHQQSDVNIRA
jgi:iron(III) transport system ATP-binding protein